MVARIWAFWPATLQSDAVVPELPDVPDEPPHAPRAETSATAMILVSVPLSLISSKSTRSLGGVNGS